MQPLSSPAPIFSYATITAAAAGRAVARISPKTLLRLALLPITFAGPLAVAQTAALPPSSLQGKSNPAEASREDFAPSAPSASWNSGAAFPSTIARYGFAQNRQEMYVIAGVSNGSVVATVRRYDAATNVWTPLAAIPVGSEAPAAAFLGGRIYSADGLGGGNLMRIYDVATNSWSAGAARPGVVNSFGAAAGAFDGRVYIIGGDSTVAAGRTTVSVYDIFTNAWSSGAAAPSPYKLGGYAQIGQFLYLIGGHTNSAGPNSMVSMRYDMAANTWSTGPSWTPARADFALAAVGNRLYAIGGDANGGSFFEPSTQVHELDTSTWPAGAWTVSPDALPTARQGNQAGFFSTSRAGGEIWSTGGIASGFVFLNQHLFRPVAAPCLNYNVTQSTGVLQVGTVDTGNHCDDCSTLITLPFPVRLYGITYTAANVVSNGSLQFAQPNTTFTNVNLPSPEINAAIFPFWDDFRTDGTGSGIFTSVTGTAPHRVFNIEWRVVPFSGSGSANFAIRLFEDSDNFEVVYGALSGAITGNFSGTIGVQGNSADLFTQFAGPSATVPTPGTRVFFSTGCCAPIAFNGTLGSNSTTYPGTSGSQTGRVFRISPGSVCGTPKTYPGAQDTSPRTYDAYTFVNNGPAACVTFNVNSACSGSNFVFPVAYLGSFNPANIAQNYLGDSGTSPNPSVNMSVNVPANATVVLVVNEVTAAAGCPSYSVVVSGLSCPVQISQAASRKVHGAAGEFDIPLPLTGEPGVECRSSSGGNHNVVVTLNSEVASGNATVSSGIGTAGIPTYLGRTMIIPLSGVVDLQKITLSLNGITNSAGQAMPNTPLSMNVLLGDTTGNRNVNASDIGQTKSQAGQPVGPTNFRTDTTVSGTINASDIGQVKANAGRTLPP